MSDKLAYWPGQDNSCDVIKGCKGAGSPGHMDHVLSELPLNKLIAAILGHCGNELSLFLSCSCCFYAREIGRRGTPEGQQKHREAVERKHKYLASKYPSLSRDDRIARTHFGVGLPDEVNILEKEIASEEKIKAKSKSRWF